MGNSASTEEDTKKEKKNDTDVTPRASNSTPTSRRIIKAKKAQRRKSFDDSKLSESTESSATPVSVFLAKSTSDKNSKNRAGSANTTGSSSKATDYFSDGELGNDSSYDMMLDRSLIYASASSVDRDSPQDQVEHAKQHLQSSSAQRKAQRVKELNERRIKSGTKKESKSESTTSVEKEDTVSTTTKGSTTSLSSSKPNPMSQFLSSFSVEPAHPELKRKGEREKKIQLTKSDPIEAPTVSRGDNSTTPVLTREFSVEIKPPSEKKLRVKEPEKRTTEGSDDKSGSMPNNSSTLFTDTRLVVAAAVVAVVAIAVTVFMRTGPSRKKV